MPTRRRTLAPRGETPQLPAWDKRGKISTIGAITISPKTKKEGFLFQMLPVDDNFNGELIIEFLRSLRKHISTPIKLIWDGAPIHRATVVRDFLAGQTRIEAFRFPGYAPDTNPVEGCWGHAKYHQLPNLVVKDADELRERATLSLDKIKCDRSLLKAFIKHAHHS
jgi:putative transposase